MDKARIATSLLALRLGVFIVMFMWTMDKFVNPQHTSAVYERFYGVSGLGETTFLTIGVAQLLLVLGFVTGFAKRYTYGGILVLHGLSTLSSWQQYLDPFKHLLFFAAWPMLAACFALYYLRDMDTLWTLDDRTS
jgi:putative oxidoreductase